MPTIVPSDRLHVVVGVLCNRQHQYLVQQRLDDKPYAGYWEFPGGKVEQGESAETALSRELSEELDIIPTRVSALTNISVDYQYAKVFLEVFLIKNFSGDPKPNESQIIFWKSKQDIKKMKILKAVNPILDLL